METTDVMRSPITSTWGVIDNGPSQSRFSLVFLPVTLLKRVAFNAGGAPAHELSRKCLTSVKARCCSESLQRRANFEMRPKGVGSITFQRALKPRMCVEKEAPRFTSFKS
jgi:hypothetical protein